MTAKELQDYLTKNHENRFYLELNIEAEMQYRERLISYDNPRVMNQYIKIMDGYIQKHRDEIDRLSAILVSWSELISKEEYRQIFLDRFLYGKKWSEIAERSHYSEKHLFNIKDKCLKEIVSKTVCELPSITDNLMTLSN